MLSEHVENILNAGFRLSRVIRKNSDTRDGLTGHQWYTLAIISKGETAIGDIARKLNVTLPTATVAVEKLVQEGLVSREESKDDRRRHLLKVTRQGQKQLAKARRAKIQSIGELLSVLDHNDVAELSRILTILADRTEELKQERP